jgi:hypothetical protein
MQRKFVLMGCVVLLQSGVCGARTGDRSIDFEQATDIKEEVWFKVEVLADVMEEIPQAKPFPDIKTEQEVRQYYQ